MITRIWHAWTTDANADAFQKLFRTEILPGIQARAIAGLRGTHMLRRDVEDGVEFVTMFWFDSLEAVVEFAGEEYTTAVVPARARELLSRFDTTVPHYDTVLSPESAPG